MLSNTVDYTHNLMKKTLLLTPALYYANEIPLLAAISAFILIFRERERLEEEKKCLFLAIHGSPVNVFQ